MRIKHQTDKGFTIIEVVLVLAIAAMILAMVFFALPSLQKSRRDTQRKSDLSRMMAQLEAYAGNNTGSYPAASAAGMTNAGGFVPTYMTAGGETWQDPTGNAYAFEYGTGAPTSTTAGTIKYGVNAACSSGTLVAGSGNRDVAAVMVLEKGSICQGNK